MNPGDTVGDFKVVRPIGEEAMGMVYLGEHVKLPQKVAIKQLHPSLVKTDGMRERFEREATVMARLNHPHLIRLLNFYNKGDEGCFIVMEFAEGETLEQKVQTGGPIPGVQAAKWMIPILKALGHAHQNGVIHRDMKPGNVLVTKDGVSKILDFGMSKAEDAPQLTVQGLTLGTVMYMSREQLLGKPVDQRSDIYSVGVTLYEITTGKLPFWDEEEKKLVLKIAKQEPPPPSMYVPNYPRELERIILKSLSKDANDRYATADAMAAALEAFVSGGASLPPPPVAPTPTPTTTPAPATTPATTPAAAPPPAILNPLTIAGIALLAVSIGLGLAVLFLAPAQKLIAAGVLGVGLPLGLVLLLVGIVRASGPRTS